MVTMTITGSEVGSFVDFTKVRRKAPAFMGI